MLAPSKAYWLPFWPIYLLASAVHTMKARGDDDDAKTATTATTATTRCGKRMRTRMMNNEGLDDENED